jgi:hypothetical protein
MSEFPRSRNGHVDDGTRLKSGSSTCPNCRSKSYFETLSTEQCSDCGLYCDYWGGGSNDVYEAMMNRNA